ncbi:hypothetical protein AQUCO_05800179v1 [Aquilegia coerulea]|uniref:Major facilitator superfamily (MFS) profile domain-containing protein n=1 Tax=Aquilegia coerulea TaxID=218851 RepID=A0A2G5CF93_AQUCA|nr:hypothetical protein AQUCO_05800179v1 [Aquilegia coerulea]
MADDTPSLLSQIDSVPVPSEVPLLGKHISSLDDAIEECMGSFGWNQFLQALLVSLAWVFDAQQTFISVFAEAAPAWHCTTDQLCNSGTIQQCQLPKTAWAWNQPAETCLVSEWNLECAGPFVTGLPASSFFFGCLMGGIVLATLADSSLGRKNMLVLSCLLMSLTGVLTVFSPNIWVYSALRFVTGFGRATIGTCALVLSTELVGKKWRGEVGILGFFCFTIGFLSLPAMAYLNKDSSWRTLYLWTSIPAIFYSTIVHFMVHESPRWLFVQGRKEEAIKVLKSLSTNINFNFSDDALSMDKETWNVDLYSGLKILWQKRWAFQRLSSVMIAGFGIGMIYYGMPLGLGNLKFNLYLSVTLNALSELPASLITFFLISKLNRKSAVLVFTFVSGVCSILCVVVVDKELQIGMELVSFFSACTAFNVLLIYTLELFPTCIRNSALSMVRQALVLGGVFSPVLVAAGRKDGFWSYGVFGLVIGCCGFIVVCLPETKGGSFCDTIDEQEYKDIKTTVTATLAGCDNGV